MDPIDSEWSCWNMLLMWSIGSRNLIQTYTYGVFSEIFMNLKATKASWQNSRCSFKVLPCERAKTIEHCPSLFPILFTFIAKPFQKCWPLIISLSTASYDWISDKSYISHGGYSQPFTSRFIIKIYWCVEIYLL